MENKNLEERVKELEAQLETAHSDHWRAIQEIDWVSSSMAVDWSELVVGMPGNYLEEEES